MNITLEKYKTPSRCTEVTPNNIFGNLPEVLFVEKAECSPPFALKTHDCPSPLLGLIYATDEYCTRKFYPLSPGFKVSWMSYTPVSEEAAQC